MILCVSRAVKQGRKIAGFSLIELAIVMTIVGLFVATASQTYRLYTKRTALNSSLEKKNNIEIALGKFMSVNGRLPCPADPALPVGDVNAGRENCRPNNVAYPTLACNATNSLCRIEGARGFVFPAPGTTVQGTVPPNPGPERVLRGGIPYVTLGLSPRDAYDGWGSMFTYAVTEMLASSFFLSQGGTTNNCIEVCNKVSENASLTLNAGAGRILTDVIYASYGNGTGTCGTSFTTGTCHASVSVDRIRTRFQGKVSDSYAASNANFGDPCSGTLKNLAVIMRACEATASVSFNEANGAIDHRRWDEGSGTDIRRRNPNVEVGGVQAFDSWMLAVVSHGPDRKGGWNAQGSMPIPCTGQGRDVINCTMSSATFIDPTYVSTTPGPTFYDDAFVSTSPIRESDKWHFSTIAAIRNKEGTMVGIGTDSPGTALDVNGAVRAMDAESTAYCNNAGGNCFEARVIGGSGIGCTGGWMKGIVNGQAVCETKIDTTQIVTGVGSCAPGSYLQGFCSDGSRICKVPGNPDPVCP
ncbi:MAG: prepilin-type N-terminal cleavage/methylation domain-containing protein [Alphaproteobacteria bacterium]